MSKKTLSDEQKNWLFFVLALISTAVLVLLYYLIRLKYPLTAYGESHSIGESPSIIELTLQILPNLIATLLVFSGLYFLFFRKNISTPGSSNCEFDPRHCSRFGGLIFSTQNEADEKFQLKEKLKTAKEICIIAYSAKYVLTQLKDEILDSLVNGASFRILLIDPKSEAFKVSVASDNSYNKEIETDLKITEETVNYLQNALNKIGSKSKGTLKIEYINWIPSCSLIIWNPSDKTLFGECKLKINSIYPNTAITKIPTHTIISEKFDKELFVYVSNQFNDFWKEKTKNH